jgi:hypothetical protein
MTQRPSSPTRRRIAAASGALALVAASVFAGTALAASAAPPVITINGGPTFYEETAGYIDFGIDGTLTDADQSRYAITVRIDTYYYCSDNHISSSEDYEAGVATWSCYDPYLALGVGSHEVTVTAYDQSDTDQVDPLGSAEATLIVYENYEGTVDSQTTSESFPVFTGSGPRMGAVAVENEAGDELCRSTIGSDLNTFECTSSVPFAVDDYIVYPHTYLADGTDLGRGTSASLEVIAPPAPTLQLQYSNSDITTNPYVWWQGEVTDAEYAEPYRVEVWVSSGGNPETLYCSSDRPEAGWDGPWSCDSAPETLPLGASTFWAYAISQGGQYSPISNTVSVRRIAHPVIIAPEDDDFYTSNPDVTLTGSFDDYALFLPDGFDFEFPWFAPDEGGWGILCSGHATTQTFTCDAEDIPADFNYYYLSVSPDEGHYFSSEDRQITLDQETPEAPLITAPGEIGTPSGMREYSGPLSTISGTGEIDATVSLTSNGDPVVCTNAPVVVDEELGSWSCTLATVPTAPGVYDYAAIQTDRAGNGSDVGPPSGQLRYTIAPTLESPANGGYYYGQTIQASGLGPVGSTIQLVDATTDTVLCSDTVDGVGEWACDVPNEVEVGAHEYFAHDATSISAGDSPLSQFVVLPDLPDVDTSPGPASISTVASGDAGSDVRIVFNTVTPGGYYFYNEFGSCPGESETPSSDQSCAFDELGPGIWNVSVTQTVEGYESNSYDDFVMIPETPVFDSAVNPNGSVTFSGTGQPGYRVIVETLDGDQVCAPTVESNTTWSCTPPLDPGTDSYRALQQSVGFAASPTSAANHQPERSIDGYSAFTQTELATVVVPPPGVFGAQNKTVELGDTFTMSGGKTPGGIVVVTIIVPNGPDLQFTPCDDSVIGNPDTWLCDYSTTGLNLPPGTYELSVVQVVKGTTSAELIPRPTLTIVAAASIPTPAPTPTATPTPTVKPPLTWKLVMTGINGALKPGQWVGLSSSGIPAGSVIDAELHSTPIPLGSTTVRPDGTFSFRVQIPMNVEPGDHHIVVTLTAPDEEPSVVENAVQIELDAKFTPVRDGDDRHLEIDGAGSIDRNDPSSPTAISRSLPTLFDIITNPATLGLAAGLAIVILLLVALPTEILNSTLEANTSRFGRFFAAIQSGIERATAWFIGVTRTPVIAVIVLLLVTSIIFGFVDPAFGFDLASLRLVLSLALALFFVTFVASSLTGVVIGRRWALESEIGMQPAALIFAVIGVMVARLLDFSPGFLVGLVIGLELAHRATDRQRVRAVVIEFSFIVGFGVLAWLVYSAWLALQGDAQLDFVGGLIQDALVAITSEGLTAVMVAMIPIGFLDGKAIFTESKRLWAVMFVVVATAFSLLVLPTALAGQQVGDIVTWVAVLVGFAVVAFGLTLWLRLTGRSSSAEAPARETVNH